MTHFVLSNLITSFSNILLLAGGYLLYANVYNTASGYLPSDFDTEEDERRDKYHKILSKLGIRLFFLGTVIQIIMTLIPFININH